MDDREGSIRRPLTASSDATISMQDFIASDELERRTALWSGCLRTLAGGAFSERAQIATLVQCTADAFSAIDARRLRLLILGCALFNDAVLVTDDTLDYGAERVDTALALTQLLPLLVEAQLVFAELFDGGSSFWNHYRRYFAEYLLGMNAEVDVRRDPRLWSGLTDRACVEIARRKNGLIRIVAAAVCELASERRALGDLEEALLLYFVGMQMVDDVRDWREDARDGNVSLLLRSASSTSPSAIDVTRLGQVIYGERHAEAVLARADDWFDRAASIAARLGTASLRALVLFRRGTTADLRAAIVEATASNVGATR